jgi:inner membrane protein
LDSLTQIVLGAACGEAVAGRKLGNRAMLWGAVGGTIPDLDVLAGFFTDEITSVSFHRGFMHSFLFAALAPWLLAFGAQWFYRKEMHRRRGYKGVAMAAWLLLYLGVTIVVNGIAFLVSGGINWWVLAPTLTLAFLFGRHLWRNYWQRSFGDVSAPYSTWVSLFFWSIFTHPILDCFTNYGTQVWQPFSDERVQWTTVSVVDPLYTVPFAICLWVASRFLRDDKRRLIWTAAGILWSCGYLFYTYWHKNQVNMLFEQALLEKKVAYTRYYTGPSIMNNIVWYGVAEADSAFYYGLYGFNDRERRFTTLSKIPKNAHLSADIPAEARAPRFVRWFSDGYYNLVPYNGDTLRANDLRFGLLGDSLRRNNYVFSFLMFKNKKGAWDIRQYRGGEDPEAAQASFSELWKRITVGR